METITICKTCQNIFIFIAFYKFYATESFDSLINRTGSGQLDTSMIAMYLVFAENESKKTAERIKHTQIEKAYAGEWNQASNPPFGYKYNKDTKKLDVDIMSSEIIKLIFKLYLSGMGMKSIAFYLNGDNEEGKIYPSSKGKKWSQYTIGYILKNQAYVGDVVFNKRSKNSRPYKNPGAIGKTDDDVYVGNDWNKKEDWIITKDAHEAIISREDFEKIQSMIKTKARRKGVKSNVSLLAGIGKCGKCGAGLTFKRGNNGRNSKITYSKYYCAHYIKYGNRHCDSHHLKADEFEYAVINNLKDEISKFVNFTDSTTGLKGKKTDLEVVTEKIKKTENDIQTLSTKTDMLLDKNMNGDITDSQFKKLNERYSQEMELLEQALIKLNLERETATESSNDVSRIEQVYNKVMNIENYPTEEQRYLLIDLIKEITLTDGNIEIHYKF